MMLSICIPTYNRAQYLKNTLESIVSCQVFNDNNDVEIVISDNCSTDETPLIAHEYISKYNGKILYNRNEKNIFDANCWKVLSLGNGEFLKLQNDTAVLCGNNALDKMLEIVKKARMAGALPFFVNGNGHAKTDIIVASLDDFISETRYWNTWICAFGIWKHDFQAISGVLRQKSRTRLPQSWALLNCVADGVPVLVCNEHLFDIAMPSKKGGYNIAEVFGYNYNTILKTHYDQGKLSTAVYSKARQDILSFVNYYYFDIERQFAFDKTGYFKWMMPFYWRSWYFYGQVIYIWAMIIKKWFRYGIVCKKKVGNVRSIVLFSKYHIFSYVSRKARHSARRKSSNMHSTHSKD